MPVPGSRAGLSADQSAEHWSGPIGVDGMTGSTALAKKFLAMDSIWFRGCEKPGKVLGLLGIARAEERVGERDRVEIPHFRIVRQRRIDKENKRHVDFLMAVEPLLVKAKTLDLVEIDAARLRRHIERRTPGNRLIAEILSGEEHQLLLPEVDLHLALHRLESPRQAGRNVAVEPHRNDLLGRYTGIGIRSLRRSAEPGCCAEEPV